MKKIFLFVLATAFLAVFSLPAFAKPPVFKTTTTMEFDGAMKSASVSASTAGVDSTKILHRVAKNKGKALNISVIFNNSSSTVTGAVSFPNDGVWLGFKGPFLLKQAERVLDAQTNGTGIIRIDGNVSFDPTTGIVSGSGKAVQFTGAVHLKGVIKKSGDRAMIKALVFPSNSNEVTFSNGTTIPFLNGTSTVTAIPVIVKMSMPAVQMLRKIQ